LLLPFQLQFTIFSFQIQTLQQPVPPPLSQTITIHQPQNHITTIPPPHQLPFSQTRAPPLSPIQSIIISASSLLIIHGFSAIHQTPNHHGNFFVPANSESHKQITTTSNTISFTKPWPPCLQSPKATIPVPYSATIPNHHLQSNQLQATCKFTVHQQSKPMFFFSQPQNSILTEPSITPIITVPPTCDSRYKPSSETNSPPHLIIHRTNP
jgi:hypothetical protein